MKKAIGIIRNDHGQIAKLVILDAETGAREAIAPGNNAETLFGRYPEYNEALKITGSVGLVLVSKRDNEIRLVTIAGKYPDFTEEAPVISKIRRLDLRIVNGDIITCSDGAEHLIIQ